MKRTPESRREELQNFGDIDKIEVNAIYLYLPKSVSKEETLSKFRIKEIDFYKPKKAR